MKIDKKINKMPIYEAFSLIELMIVIAIIAFLSMLTVPSMMTFLAKAKRTEAYTTLGSLAMAQKAYFAENGTYTANLEKLNWQPEGNFNYSYGFGAGSEGKNYFKGKLNASSSELSKSYIKPNGFLVCAAGDIDGDGLCDIISINEKNEVQILQNDLV